MKKSIFKNLLKYAAIFMSAVVVLSSCNKDDDDDKPDPTPPVEDGIYIVGDATALATPDIKGVMKVTRNEVVQEDRVDLLEAYIAVKATGGFNIVEVNGATTTTYGPGSDFAVVAEADRDTDEPQVDFQRGSYTESATKFTVPADGLYHIAIDKELGVAVVVPVTWGVIGAATPGGWGASTELPAKAFGLESMEFEGTDIALGKADWKFRYSSGWKVNLDTVLDLGGGNKGVKVNTNFGGAVDALVPGGDNMANDAGGYYTINMTWTLGSGHAATLTKTGDFELVDYTDTQLGLIGNGLIVDGSQYNWDAGWMLHTPTVDGTNYTWSWDMETTTDGDGSFKIREGDNWDGLSFGYPQVIMAGPAAADFETNGDGNFVPLKSAQYTFEFLIDAAADEYTVTVTEK